MSNFVDYYEDLQISPNADKETIERVFRLLARRWHPDNQTTGDHEKFNVITTAYRALSNPETRAAYDATYEKEKSCRWQAFSEHPSAAVAREEVDARFGILSILYTSRRQDPENGSVGLWHLSKLLGWPENEIAFHVWYLKEKHWIQRTDSGGYAITANGAEIVEERKVAIQKHNLLTAMTSVNA